MKNVPTKQQISEAWVRLDDATRMRQEADRRIYRARKELGEILNRLSCVVPPKK